MGGPSASSHLLKARVGNFHCGYPQEQKGVQGRYGRDAAFFIVAFSLGGLHVIVASFQTLFHTNVQCTHIS